MRDQDESVNVKCCDLEVDLGRVRVLRRVSFDCCKGEWTVLTGPSGSGKSTLLRAINGLCPPSAGSVWALGSCMPGRRKREAQRVWRSTGTVLQDLGLFETRTARANVEIGLRAAGHDRGSARRAAGLWLERLGLDDVRDAYPGRLSGGERQRVALARAIAPAPQLLILDEPTAHLDDRSAKIVLAAVKELVQQGATVVMSSHRPDEVADVASCHIEIEAGEVRHIRR